MAMSIGSIGPSLTARIWLLFLPKWLLPAPHHTCLQQLSRQSSATACFNNSNGFSELSIKIFNFHPTDAGLTSKWVRISPESFDWLKMIISISTNVSDTRLYLKHLESEYINKFRGSQFLSSWFLLRRFRLSCNVYKHKYDEDSKDNREGDDECHVHCFSCDHPCVFLHGFDLLGTVRIKYFLKAWN